VPRAAHIHGGQIRQEIIPPRGFPDSRFAADEDQEPAPARAGLEAGEAVRLLVRAHRHLPWPRQCGGGLRPVEFPGAAGSMSVDIKLLEFSIS